MQVLAHPDPWRLEAELCRQVSVCQTDDPLKPILVIVPTARLAGHVRRRLAAGQTALLGVEVLAPLAFEQSGGVRGILRKPCC